VNYMFAAPIAEQDTFFDVAFMSGFPADRSLLKLLGEQFSMGVGTYAESFEQSLTQAFKLSGKLTKEQQQALVAAGQITDMSQWYKVRSFFKKYSSIDPFSRFDKNSPNWDGQALSFYHILARNLQEELEKDKDKKVNASLRTGIAEGNERVAFFNLDSYKYFLNGCQQMAQGRLAAIDTFMEMPKTFSEFSFVGKGDFWSGAVGGGGPSIGHNVGTEFRREEDVVPFYTELEFSTEKRLFSSNDSAVNINSMMQYLTSKPIQPFFNQLLSLYIEINEKPDKWFKKPWIKSEPISLFGQFGSKYASHDSPFITIGDGLKDADFFNLSLEGFNASSCANIVKKLSFNLFANKIKPILAGQLEDNQDLFKNPRYQETICYRIQKTDSRTKFVQNWYVPNFPELDIIKIFDNRVAFDAGEDYTYEVFTLKAVVGIKYQYQTISGRNIGDFTPEYGQDGVPLYYGINIYLKGYQKNGSPLTTVDPKEALKDSDGNITILFKKGDLMGSYINDLEDLKKQEMLIPPYGANKYGDLEFNVKAEPELVLLEVPYFSKNDVVIYDSAPVAPELTIYPFKGVDNKVDLWFNTDLDQFAADYIPILTDDKKTFLKSQNYGRQHYYFSKEQLYFKSEQDDVKYYQLFRLDKAPRKFDDFADSRLMRILRFANPLQKLDPELLLQYDHIGESFIDDLIPNRDYYYMIRAVDYTGNVSNPSPIYHVRLDNDDGFINPIIDFYDMEAREVNKLVTTSPKFKKILSIAPAEDQMAVEIRKGAVFGVGALDEFIVGTPTGNDTQPLFYPLGGGKKFKVRITSLKTNKKVDLNISFTTTINQIKSVDELPDDPTLVELEVASTSFED